MTPGSGMAQETCSPLRGQMRFWSRNPIANTGSWRSDPGALPMKSNKAISLRCRRFGTHGRCQVKKQKVAGLRERMPSFALSPQSFANCLRILRVIRWKWRASPAYRPQNGHRS